MELKESLAKVFSSFLVSEPSSQGPVQPFRPVSDLIASEKLVTVFVDAEEALRETPCEVS